MKILCSLMVVFIFRQTIAGIVRKPPAFSTPMYSNSYLPAVMQVTFHAVGQLKQIQAEEISQEQLLTAPSTSMTLLMKQSTTPGRTSAMTTATTAKMNDEQTEAPKLSATLATTSEASNQESSGIYVEISTVSVPVVSNSDHEELPEVNEETTETNYELPATPETNHESPEPVQETQESNQELPEENEEEKPLTTENSSGVVSKIEISQQSTQASVAETLDSQKKKEPTVDSVVDGIYGIVKTTSSPFNEESDESKSATGISIEKMESIEEEEEETRFTLLGEKVAQVPRPSLNSYLKRTKIPPRPSIQQLANLYDALSKDARKQGFARFAGYSDEVLQTLQSSAEGGVGPQLKKLLEKVVERNELTRDDAKMRTSQALRDLDNPASALSKDLRRLLPLRYTL